MNGAWRILHNFGSLIYVDYRSVRVSNEELECLLIIRGNGCDSINFVRKSTVCVMKTKGCAIDENCDLQKEFHWMKYWENKKMRGKCKNCVLEKILEILLCRGAMWQRVITSCKIITCKKNSVEQYIGQMNKWISEKNVKIVPVKKLYLHLYLE